MAPVKCVIGRHGFLGGALAERMGPVTSYPVPGSTKVLFHFGSYVHPSFEMNPEYLMKQAIDSFTQLLPYCYDHGILFVYPSSALVYEKETQFARFKKTLESLAACYKTRSIGLRIFPAYGPGENRTVISQWCRLMKQGEPPVVYGDGNQSRDFIFIDDAVDQILSLTERPWVSKVADVGTGIRTSFNEIIEIINRVLGTTIQAKYVERPSVYPEGIVCPSPLPTKVSIETGIRRILAL